MNTSLYQKAIAITLLAVAAVFLAAGMVHARKIYEKQDKLAQFGQVTFDRVSDRQLVVDATFTGVERKNNKLFSTYDRSQPHGKKACPT